MPIAKDKSSKPTGVGERLKQAVNVGMGNSENTLKPKTVYLNVEHYEQMTIIAKERGLKTADLIRQSMKEFLDRN